MADKTLHVVVITPARAVFEDQAVSVVVPAFDGELGVLPGHAALMSLLGPGGLRLTQANGAKLSLAVRGGFLQVHGSKVTVLTPEAVPVEDLDAGAVNKELAEAEGQKAVSDAEIKLRDQKLAWARARRKLLEANAGTHRN
ncbi:MAG: ATP synthase F1 subunit epsilon [Planctomycetes bacterium]|nr:ATP synthase F1 subunit epsilon [Planctomycetota bacterium]